MIAAHVRAFALLRPRPEETDMTRYASTLPMIPFAAVALAFGMGTTRCETAPPGSCVVDGVVYDDGARDIPAPDGCNTCFCEDGALACTERACIPDDLECVVGDVSYPDGSANVPAGDGCNTCTCSAGALTQCTEIACSACSVYGESYSGSAPSNDGCNTCGCEDGQVTAACTRIGCGPIVIEPCEAWSEFPGDPFELNSATVNGDTLSVSVSYSGGCAPHYFRLCYDGAFLESFPVQANVVLQHDGQGDACEAYPTETREFDLRPLAEAYREAYQTETGTVILRLADGVEYSF
jgi:hypothetical protein